MRPLPAPRAVPQPRGASARPPRKGGARGISRSKSRRGFRPLRVLGRILFTITVVLLIGIGALYAKLLQGPLSIGFLASSSVRALNAELPGLVVAIDDAVVQIKDRVWPEVSLQRVRLTDEQGRLVASANSAEVAISLRSLAFGIVGLERITLNEPRFRLAYDKDGKLNFSSAGDGRSSEPKAIASNPASAASVPATNAASGGTTGTSADPQADSMHMMRALIARLRRTDDTASLQTIAFKTATFEIEGPTGKDSWKIDDLAIDLSHRQKRSTVRASAKIVSNGQPWTIDVNAEEAEKAQTFKVDLAFAGLVPRNIGRELPAFAALAGLDVPLSGTASASLDSSAGLQKVVVQTSIGAGNVYLAGLNGIPFAVDRGSLKLQTTGAGIAIDRLAIESGQNRLNFAGLIDGDRATGFAFDLASTEGMLEAPNSAPPLRVETLVLRGRAGPAPGHVDITQLLLKVAGAELSASGRMDGATHFEGRISPMSLATLKALWPASLASRSRAFVVEHVTKGELKGGAFKLSVASSDDPAVKRPGERQQSVTLEAGDIELQLRKDLPPMEIPRALLRLEGDGAELTIPEAQITAGGQRRLTFKGGRFTAVNIDKARPLAELSVRSQGSVQALVELLDREPVNILKSNSISIPAAHIDGKLDAQFKLTFPLIDTMTAGDLKIDGRARITDGRVKDVFGTHDINGATINVAATDKGIDLRGEMLLAGIAAKLTGQWQSGTADNKHPNVRLSARLDTADRNQLGLNLDDLVQGEVPIEITLQRGKGDELGLRVSGDLTSAELQLEELHWRKPVGRPARVEFDVGRGRQGKGLELQNFKVTGENIAIDGWVGVGPDNRAREYYFPEFSLNVVSNLEVQGTLRPDRVWDVKAQGKTFDGRDFFRSLYAFGREQPKQPRKDKPGIDIQARIDNVLGAHETSLRQVELRFSKRAEQVTGLDMKGVLDGGDTLTAIMKPDAGRQKLVGIDTTNAGQALKLIGFYPNMVGGKGHLEINLEGRGAVEKTGTINIRRFNILGDPIISEVFQSADDSKLNENRPAIAAGASRRRVVREQFEFESLKANFSVGNAQVVIEESDARGPLVGVGLRGKLDFRAQRMDLGGNYIPLSGLNRVVGQIPIISPILTGPRGEGVLGIPFAITGPMAEPQVIFNPLALGAPGFLRELFQMGPYNPKVTPRGEPQPKSGTPQVRSSPPTEQRRGPDGRLRTEPEVSDGWSSSTTPAGPEGKR